MPICDRALYSAFGAESPFGFGIQNFSIQYGILNTSLNPTSTLVQTHKRLQRRRQAAGLGTDISNISSVVNKLSTDPLFPPPANANFGNCNAGTASQQPWYCVAVGYCGFLNANATLLGSISSVQQQLVIRDTIEGADKLLQLGLAADGQLLHSSGKREGQLGIIRRLPQRHLLELQRDSGEGHARCSRRAPT